MTPADRTPFGRAIVALATTFGLDLLPTRLEAYWQALEDMDLRDVEQAVRLAMQGEEFFPAPARLRHLVRGSGYQPGDGPLPPPSPPATREMLRSREAIPNATLEQIREKVAEIDAAYAARRAADEQARLLSPEAVEERKALLRAQAKRWHRE